MFAFHDFRDLQKQVEDNLKKGLESMKGELKGERVTPEFLLRVLNKKISECDSVDKLADFEEDTAKFVNASIDSLRKLKKNPAFGKKIERILKNKERIKKQLEKGAKNKKDVETKALGNYMEEISGLLADIVVGRPINVLEELRKFYSKLPSDAARKKIEPLEKMVKVVAGFENAANAEQDKASREINGKKELIRQAGSKDVATLSKEIKDAIQNAVADNVRSDKSLVSMSKEVFNGAGAAQDRVVNEIQKSVRNAVDVKEEDRKRADAIVSGFGLPTGFVADYVISGRKKDSSDKLAAANRISQVVFGALTNFNLNVAGFNADQTVMRSQAQINAQILRNTRNGNENRPVQVAAQRVSETRRTNIYVSPATGEVLAYEKDTSPVLEPTLEERKQIYKALKASGLPVSKEIIVEEWKKQQAAKGDATATAFNAEESDKVVEHVVDKKADREAEPEAVESGETVEQREEEGKEDSKTVPLFETAEGKKVLADRDAERERENADRQAQARKDEESRQAEIAAMKVLETKINELEKEEKQLVNDLANTEDRGQKQIINERLEQCRETLRKLLEEKGSQHDDSGQIKLFS